MPLRRVLIADDDGDFRNALAMSLELDGWTVLEARNGDEALSLARGARPSVIVLDARMPEKSGEDVYRALRADGIATPVLLVTEELDAPRIAAELDLPHFLGKPFRIDELHAALERATGSFAEGR